MHQSNDIDNAVNGVTMVIDNQQKRSLFLYNICSILFLYTVSARVMGWYTCSFGVPPACTCQHLSIKMWQIRFPISMWNTY